MEKTARPPGGTFQNQNSTEPKTPPGPKGNVLLKPDLALRNQTLNYLQKLEKEYGKICKIKFGPFKAVFLADIDYIEHLLLNREIYVKMKEGSALAHMLGNGLLTSEGDFWLKQRRLIQPVFHKQRLEKMIKTISDSAQEMLVEWKGKCAKALDIYPEMNRLTLDVVSKTLLNAEVKADFIKVNQAITHLMQALRRRPKFMRFPFWVPIPAHIQFKRNIAVLDKTILDIITQRRSDMHKHEDLLTMLMDVEDADTAERMTDKQLRDETLTIFMAGHETTANALSFILYLLARNPEVKAKVQEEVIALKNTALTMETLRRLEYTTMVINEAMRLYPPAWLIVREAAKDDVIGGYLIKKGDKVFTSPYVMQRSEKYWQNPELFNPERFAADKMKAIPRYAFFPFGGGARLCVGMNFAIMEMQVIIVQICTRYDFSIAPDFRLQTVPLITLRPQNGVPLKLQSLG